MDSRTIVTRRTKVSVALAVAGAIVFMAGIAVTLTGEEARLQKAAGWHHLVNLGILLAACGLALGAAFAVVVMARLPSRGRRGRQPARPGDVGDQALGDQALGDQGLEELAEDWLSPLRGGGMRAVGGPVTDVAREAAAAREIHHPVRPMAATVDAGRHSGTATGEFPAYLPSPAAGAGDDWRVLPVAGVTRA